MTESCSTTVQECSVVAQPLTTPSLVQICTKDGKAVDVVAQEQNLKPRTLPLTVNIIESAKFPVRHRVGKVKRKSKGREYVSPRILLSQRLKRHIGKGCLVFECRGSVENSVYHLEDKDILILVLLP
jgi:hypothetical protein